MPAVCTTPMCSEGRSKVRAMWDTFNGLKADYPNFRASVYEPTCHSIQAQLDSIDSWYADMIPFNPDCCTMAEIGVNAATISNQMLASVGASPLPETPEETDWVTVALVGGAVLLLLVYSPQVKSIFK